MSCWEIRNFLFGISRWHAAIFICAMMQVCKTGCHIWILCVACDAGTRRQRQQNQPGKFSRCIIYKHENRWGISSLLHWGGEDSFQECPSALATLSQSPWISKASLCLDRNLKVPSYLRHLRHWSSENFRRWQCFIYISFLSIYSPQKLTAGPCK